LPDIIWKADLFYFRDIQRQSSDSRGHAIVFPKDIYSKLQGAISIGAIDAVLVLEYVTVLLAQKWVDKLLRYLGCYG
jgi:hypothetical protein